jgi:oxaloacetate decarboxylase gamma subunit
MFLLAQLPTETLMTQLKNGLVLLVLGMSIVFLFLTILVFTTKGVSKVVRKFEKKKPAAQPVAQAAQPAAAAAPAQAADAEVAVAIAAAMAKSQS